MIYFVENCPSGSIYVNSGKSCYKVLTDSNSYAHHQQACQTEGRNGRLATLHSEEIYNGVLSLVQGAKGKCHYNNMRSACTRPQTKHGFSTVV